MSYRWMCVALLACGCAFDTSGSSSGADAQLPNTLPDAGPADASDEVADAGPGCVDEDDDGFYRAVAPGAMCGPADCDDSNEDVYPGQTGAFTTPTDKGSASALYPGLESHPQHELAMRQITARVEEKLSDTRLGDGCHADVFGPCEGTGWLGAVPECGEPGTWHRCEWGTWSCEETERVDAVMPCV